MGQDESTFHQTDSNDLAFATSMMNCFQQFPRCLMLSPHDLEGPLTVKTGFRGGDLQQNEGNHLYGSTPNSYASTKVLRSNPFYLHLDSDLPPKMSRLCRKHDSLYTTDIPLHLSASYSEPACQDLSHNQYGPKVSDLGPDLLVPGIIYKWVKEIHL